LCGRPHFDSCHWDCGSVSPSLELCGRPPYGAWIEADSVWSGIALGSKFGGRRLQPLYSVAKASGAAAGRLENMVVGHSHVKMLMSGQSSLLILVRRRWSSVWGKNSNMISTSETWLARASSSVAELITTEFLWRKFCRFCWSTQVIKRSGCSLAAYYT